MIVEGLITKAGNTYARQLLIEAAWQHRRPYARSGERLLHQLDLVAPATRIRALEGNHEFSSGPSTIFNVVLRFDVSDERINDAPVTDEMI